MAGEAFTGFSTPKDFWADLGISGLAITSSSENASTQTAEAFNEYGDTISLTGGAVGGFAEIYAPSCEYVVIGDVSLSDIKLGTIVKLSGTGDTQRNIMLSGVSISTGAGQNPTVTLSGVEVEKGGSVGNAIGNSTTRRGKRVYPLPAGTLSPTHKAQDFFGALNATVPFKRGDDPSTGTALSQASASASIDPHITTIKGEPKYADASHCVLNLSFTATDITGSATFQYTSSPNAWKVSSTKTRTARDSGYDEISIGFSLPILGTDVAVPPSS